MRAFPLVLFVGVLLFVLSPLVAVASLGGAAFRLSLGQVLFLPSFFEERCCWEVLLAFPLS